MLPLSHNGNACFLVFVFNGYTHSIWKCLLGKGLNQSNSCSTIRSLNLLHLPGDRTCASPATQAAANRVKISCFSWNFTSSDTEGPEFPQAYSRLEFSIWWSLPQSTVSPGCHCFHLVPSFSPLQYLPGDIWIWIVSNQQGVNLCQFSKALPKYTISSAVRWRYENRPVEFWLQCSGLELWLWKFISSILKK